MEKRRHMLVPWAPTWRTETNSSICHRVLLQKREVISQRTQQYLKKYQHDSSLGCHINVRSLKSLEIQAQSIEKARTHSEQMNLSFSAVFAVCGISGVPIIYPVSHKFALKDKLMIRTPRDEHIVHTYNFRSTSKSRDRSNSCEFQRSALNLRIGERCLARTFSCLEVN